MAHVIHWLGFAGGWLLVAGPLLQGATELVEESQDTIEWIDTLRTLPRPAPISPWWWLLPPVAIALRYHQSHQLQQTAQAVLDPEQIDTLKRLSDKANAWLIVAGGAFLLAVAETWSPRQSYAWDEWVFWLLVVAMAAACALVTSYGVHRRGLRMERVPG